jgi:hypothetical protein
MSHDGDAFKVNYKLPVQSLMPPAVKTPSLSCYFQPEISKNTLFSICYGWFVALAYSALRNPDRSQAFLCPYSPQVACQGELKRQWGHSAISIVGLLKVTA